MQKEIEMVDKEMNKLEEMLANKINVLKCAETRLENRAYRPVSELCKDEVELGLKNEVLSFKQTEEDLIKILEHVKYVYFLFTVRYCWCDFELLDIFGLY